MDKNEIKKTLYREKPDAYLVDTAEFVWTYQATINGYHYRFEVPVSDMGETKFRFKEPAQLLIRWLV